jgi:streptomycin 6-kinase
MSKQIIAQSTDFLSAQWQLSNLVPLTPSPFTPNFVCRAYSELLKAEVVLKICPLDDISNEQRTLHYFEGNGCVKLLAYDLKHRGLLLEYLQPGTSVKQLFPHEDPQAVEIAAAVIKRLHAYPRLDVDLSQFPTINSWLQLLGEYNREKVPKRLLEKAKLISDRLLATQGKLYLLHGDLHHDNILRRQDAWMVINPKGVVGELEYELGAFIRNPVPELLQQTDAREIIVRRIEQFSDAFSFDKQRVQDWVFVQAVLAACWSEWDYYIAFSELVETL